VMHKFIRLQCRRNWGYSCIS